MRVYLFKCKSCGITHATWDENVLKEIKKKDTKIICDRTGDVNKYNVMELQPYFGSYRNILTVAG